MSSGGHESRALYDAIFLLAAIEGYNCYFSGVPEIESEPGLFGAMPRKDEDGNQGHYWSGEPRR